jgi:DHA2 family multidrug resistance protein-like MFS transporter
LFAILAIIFGLKEIAQDGLGPLAISSIAFGIAVGVVFVRRQLTLDDPMIDLSLFRIRAFNASLATNVLGIFIAFGYFLFVAQYLQLVLGLSPLEAGLWSLPSALGFIVGSQAAPWILRRVRPAYVIGVGLAMAAVGLAMLTGVEGTDDLTLVITASVIASLGLAPVFTATTELIVGSAPLEQAGATSGISETGSGSVGRSARDLGSIPARPSTGASSRTSCPPVSPRKRLERLATRSAGRSARPTDCPDSWGRRWWKPPRMRSSRGCA